MLPTALTGPPVHPPARALRIVVDEPLPLLRSGLTHTLTTSGGHEVVAVTGDAATLRTAVAAHRPDMVVADAEHLPEVLALRRDHPATGVLVLARQLEAHHVPDLLSTSGGAAPGTGYLLHRRTLDETRFLGALNRVAHGEIVLDPDAVAASLRVHEAADPLSALSPQELGVLALMSKGRTNTAIARELVVSNGTVEKRVAGIFTKLGLAQSAVSNRRVLAVLRYLSAGTAAAIRSAPEWARTSTGAVPRTASVAK
ncbi:response regulator transcription factor [Streptomyces sp. NPDC041068]|uniref:response regulator transcription factor n=1 Tax=Streptomyces sp. NPDC041068 TaxID=3155130 RepID=UPI0033FBBCCF